jgi:hypothetical protein
LQPKKRKHRLFERHVEEEGGHFLNASKQNEEDRLSTASPVKAHEHLDDLRNAISQRNHRECEPKFYVKPRGRKEIEEHKSLRLKTAVSANPAPTLQWNLNGVILETGNKYSIFHDGDFYSLEVHHVSKNDEGFYNCTAENELGFATCTTEVVVQELPETPMEILKKRIRREPMAPEFIEPLPEHAKVSV